MRKIITAAFVLVASFSLQASLDGYFMLSVFSQGQLPSPAYSISGGRVSLIYGECQEFYGLAVGLAGQVQENMYGLQINGLWSGVDADMSGVQIGSLNLVEGNSIGLQVGVLNSSSEVDGVQMGLVNLSADFRGWQLGAYNDSCDFRGLQLGVMNKVRSLYGCQIGLINVVTARDWPVWPVINIGW